MNKIKSTLGTAGASLVMVMGMAGAAAADVSSATVCTSNGVLVSAAGECSASATDNSRTITVSGNCSGYFRINSEQSNENGTAQLGGSTATNTSATTAALAADNTNSGSAKSNVDQTNGTTQGNTVSFVFSPNCSTTNVTQQAAAPAPAPAAPAASVSTASAVTSSAPQVVAPTGGVHAGGGAGVATSGIPAAAGLTASLASVGLGLVMRKKALFEL